ncbi:MAG: hypothetical protein A3F84_17650 [Candidatus Handelsmanbacteria bacterium RIFCSPLOWO2_12_FULL_64_10]|uniref:Flagellar assembly protein T C-terminal domain-containing protein n=1 Tax=Handelsmanbacteria sp. (strain RIFCSPLOWO2_12_FULL_64_10) TaxID=1817868 RepID=A0A1F6D6F3_HANXR|nr:MAG: hypothetical protein A3F84_17650 [Candidatus Handelsmanbacteria bacterium RIFCSPLOWO2_12_FULL_64_10]
MLVFTSLLLLSGPAFAQEPHAPPPPGPAPAASSRPAHPTKGYVLRVMGKIIYLDLGLRDNVRVGDTFEIVRDEEIVHPITGENLGGKTTVGTVRVTQVFEKLSVAEVVSLLPGATMTKLDRIRMGNEPMEPPPQPQAEAAPTPMPTEAPEAHTGELVRNPDGVLRGLDIGLGGGYETKQKTRTMGADLLIPLTKRFSLGGDYGVSKESHADTTLNLSTTDSENEMGGRLRIYLGRWLRGGEDINPDGDVGSIVLDLGGGTRSLKTVTDRPAIIDTTKTPPDTTRQASVTTTKASESALRFGLILPMARKWTLGLGYDWEKNLSQVSGWLRYYTSPIDPDWAGANPDGKTGSLVVTLFGSYDTKGVTSKKWMGVDLKIPLSGLLTFGLTYDTNQKLRRIRGGLNVHIEKKLW